MAVDPDVHGILRQVNRCPACGHLGSHDDPLIAVDDGWYVHTSHTTDPRSSYYRAEQKG